jgi:uncharacterized protein YjbI with pentapeptide repeats
MSNRRDGRAAAIEALLAVARREALMLAIATSTLDDDAAAIASARLRWAIDAARPLIADIDDRARSSPAAGDAITERGAGHAEQLDRIANRAQRWLVDEPLRSLPELARLVDRAARRDHRAAAITADHVVLVDLDHLDLPGLSLTGARLDEVSLRRATCTAADARASRWQRCALDRAGLAMAVFSEARLERCDLTGAELTGTSWHRAGLAHICLRGATLVDARLDRASFTDCDLRGADLAIARSPHVATLAGARFLRCDLRDTDWRGRDLAGASFVDCRLWGARGAPRVAGGSPT